jgi:rod shape-determining protein MreD
VRKAWFAPVLLACALLLQLTVLNGLHLSGGGVPDLVLVLVVALAMTDEPPRGMVIGFAAGLCLDLAPPGSVLIGQYALVFCLAGWAAGWLGRLARHWPLRALVLAAAVIAAAEVLAAALGLLLEPAEVTIAEVRQFLPVSIAYDLLICPFALYLVLLASGLLASPGLASTGLAGPGLGRTARAGLLAVPTGSTRAQRKRRRHEPRLSPAAARPGDGWVGGRPGGQTSAAPARRPARLHPRAGVAGSASGLVRHRDRPVTPVNIRLSGSRRGDGAIGSVVGSGQGQHWRASRLPGLLAGVSSQFRPVGGSTASSARLRTSASQSALALSGRSGLGTAVPKMHFRTASRPVARRPAAAPKFRRRSGRLRPAALTTGLVAGGMLDQSTFRARRKAVGVPRLRLAGGRRGWGMLGGSGRSAVWRPPARVRKQPRFSYGRRSLLSYLTRRHIGGRWLRSRRMGSRRRVWLIGSRTGGAR